MLSSLTIFLLLDTQLIFGAHLSGSNTKGKRKKTKSQKQCDSKENHCVQEACKPEVTSGCSDYRKHRLENEGLKNKIQKLERNLNMGCKNQVSYHTIKFCRHKGLLVFYGVGRGAGGI